MSSIRKLLKLLSQFSSDTVLCSALPSTADLAGLQPGDSAVDYGSSMHGSSRAFPGGT